MHQPHEGDEPMTTQSTFDIDEYDLLLGQPQGHVQDLRPRRSCPRARPEGTKVSARYSTFDHVGITVSDLDAPECA